MLVEGPVRIEMPDGSVVESDRFMVAICTCRRSKTYPLCDTSHRGVAGVADRQPSGRRKRAAPGSPARHQVVGQPVLHHVMRPDAEDDVALQTWLPATRSPTTSVRTTCSCTASASTCSR